MESNPQGAAGSTPKGEQPRLAMAGVLLFVILQTTYPWQNGLSPERAFSGAKMSSAIILSQDGPRQTGGALCKISPSDQPWPAATRQKSALCLIFCRASARAHAFLHLKG